MARTRSFVLVLLISFAVLSYFSFDAYIRTPVTQLPIPSHSHSHPSTPPPPILLVSAFFPLPNSKHSLSDYKSWLSRFLAPITTPIYFFTTPEFAPLIQSLRGPGLPIAINTTFSSPFDIPPLKDTRERYEEMWGWDREKHRHNPELYAIWSAKPYFLDEGLRNAAGGYEYAFWTDAGSFRDSHEYAAWPDPGRVKEVWEEGSRASGTEEGDLIFFPMWAPPHSSMQFWTEGMGPIDNEFSEGSFFGGSPRSIKWWRALYYTYHNQYLSHDIFVGKDQTLINSLFLLHPQRIISVWLGDPSPPPPSIDSPSKTKRAFLGFGGGNPATPLGACGSTWYYYQFFFASPSEREGMTAGWGSAWKWSWSWLTGGGAGETDGRCRLTRVIAMERLLKSVFGEGWRVPGSTVSIDES